MLLRVAARALAVPLLVGSPAFAREPAKPPPLPAAAKPAATPKPDAREPAGGSTPGKQRQKACIAEWRSLAAAEKTAKGPSWPQFYSTCVKRLKGAQRG